MTFRVRNKKSSDSKWGSRSFWVLVAILFGGGYVASQYTKIPATPAPLVSVAPTNVIVRATLVDYGAAAASISQTQFAATPEPQGCPRGCIYPPPGCVIKGNISYNTGEKIYHVPSGQYYAATVINPNQGERWFCTEAEAQANGWRRSKK